MALIEWAYLPRNVEPPESASDLMHVVDAASPAISTAESSAGLSSDDVLARLRPGMIDLGYEVESSKKSHE